MSVQHWEHLHLVSRAETHTYHDGSRHWLAIVREEGWERAKIAWFIVPEGEIWPSGKSGDKLSILFKRVEDSEPHNDVYAAGPNAAIAASLGKRLLFDLRKQKKEKLNDSY